MRLLWVALVALVTALTFYSALWFKSVDIEADITNRVTENLNSANAGNIGVDVDGRHVTLTGIVSDEAQEAQYLGIADATDGALGPIDGLTYLEGRGYVAAVKSSDGVVLNGAVPDDATRTGLVTAAAAATDGDVTDNLTVSGSKGAWHDEAAFGLQQLAGLSSGAMVAGSDGLSLSGSVDGDTSAIQSALDGREGWVGTLTTAAPSADMTARLADLEGAVQMRDERLGALEADLADRDVQINGLNTQISGLTGELEGAKVNLGSMQAQLDAATGAEGSGLSARITELEGNLASKSAAAATALSYMNTRTAQRDEARSMLMQKDDRIAELEAMLADEKANSDRAMVYMRTRTAQRDAARLEAAEAQANLTTQTNAAASLMGALNRRSAQTNDAQAMIDGLKLELADRDTRIAEFEAGSSVNVTTGDASGGGSSLMLINALNARTAERDDAQAMIDGLKLELEDSNSRIGELEADASAATAARNAHASVLTALNARTAERDARIAERDAAREIINDLYGTVSARDVRIAELEAMPDLSGDLAAISKERDVAIARVTARNGQLAAARNALGDLRNTIAARDATIVELNAKVPDLMAQIATYEARPTFSSSMTDNCNARARGVMDGKRIGFETSSASITAESVALLERLTGVALACANEGLALEIGGHTDSRGSAEANQVLSQARAQAVLNFMEARGVSADGLAAVGYGEDRPIADNDTAEGQAANRRITFDWQAR